MTSQPRINRRLARSLAFIVCTLPAMLLLARHSSATTWYVNQGGTGDATTIAGGLSLAQPGDRVLVAAGTYLEHDVQLKPSVELRSESGPAMTIIDAGHAGNGVIGADGAIVRGFTIVHAAGLNAAAINCYQASPDIFDNVLEDNDTRVILLYQSTSTIQGNIIRCNPGIQPMADAIVAGQSTPYIAQNAIEADDLNGNASAINLMDTGPGGIKAARIEDNLIIGRLLIGGLQRSVTTEILRNVCIIKNGFSEVFNIASSQSPLMIDHNTIVGGSGIFMQGNSLATITNSIVTGARTGIELWGGVATLGCNDFWDNQVNYSGCSPGPSDFSADPHFCEEATGNYGIADSSPCAPANAPAGCALVGAVPVSCVESATVRMSWGEVKARYR